LPETGGICATAPSAVNQKVLSEKSHFDSFSTQKGEKCSHAATLTHTAQITMFSAADGLFGRANRSGAAENDNA
jgi:hypothetical protein